MTLLVTSLLGNSQRLDGGAMFGNAPRAVWEKWYPPDASHRILLACRSFLVEEGDKKVLLEAGIGLCFPPHLRARYGVEEDRHLLLDSLADRGVSEEDISVVILSHLHFDHAGGLLAPPVEGEEPRLLFPRATYVVGAEAWKRALHPHSRDRASFLPGVQALLQSSGRLHVVAGDSTPLLGPRFRFRFTDGHTPGLTHTLLEGDSRRAVFASDLIPGRAWVHLPITMGYDRWPERLIDEKSSLYEDLTESRDLLLYTHDGECAASWIERGGEGRWRTSGEMSVLDALPI